MTYQIVADPSAPLDTPIVNLASALADHYRRHDDIDAASVTIAAVIAGCVPARAALIGDVVDSLHIDQGTP